MPVTILIAEDYDDNRELLRLLLAGARRETGRSVLPWRTPIHPPI
jgi:CheY-like chemotaxis protein